MPLNSVFGTAIDAGAFFPSSLTRATPSVALAFSDFASNGSGNCNGEVLQPANRARQTTTDNGWRKKAKLGLWHPRLARQLRQLERLGVLRVDAAQRPGNVAEAPAHGQCRAHGAALRAGEHAEVQLAQ